MFPNVRSIELARCQDGNFVGGYFHTNVFDHKLSAVASLSVWWWWQCLYKHCSYLCSATVETMSLFV